MPGRLPTARHLGCSVIACRNLRTVQPRTSTNAKKRGRLLSMYNTQGTYILSGSNCFLRALDTGQQSVCGNVQPRIARQVLFCHIFVLFIFTFFWIETVALQVFTRRQLDMIPIWRFVVSSGPPERFCMVVRLHLRFLRDYWPSVLCR